MLSVMVLCFILNVHYNLLNEPTNAESIKPYKHTQEVAKTSRGSIGEAKGSFKITSYCDCKSCCGKTDGITYSGIKAKEGRTIAVDPKVIPIGSRVYIEGAGYRIAEDTGGAIKGKEIDLFFDDHEEALKWGVQTREVWIIE